MRVLTSEILNGAIFAALVVLASEMQRAGAPAPSAGPSRHSGTVTDTPSSQSEVRPAGRDSYAVRSLAGSSWGAPAATDAGVRTEGSVAMDPAYGSDKTGQASTPTMTGSTSQAAAQAALQISRDPSQPVTATVSPIPTAASPGERAGALPAARAIDAFVPPIKRQRPATPPLVFKVPSENQTARSPRKPAKAQVKRAARKAEVAARSSLGAGARNKVASEAASKSKQ